MKFCEYGPWPYPQTLYYAGKACQGQNASLLQKLVNYERTKFYNIILGVQIVVADTYRFKGTINCHAVKAK
jgi:hypothetical protein